jgi:hypothetical protein
MRVCLVAIALIGSVGASAATLPPDLVARTNQLRSQASLKLLSWVDEQGLALARSPGPLDVAALRGAARKTFRKNQGSPAGSSAPDGGTTFAVLGDLGNSDIEAIAFLVLMQAAKSAQEDLKAIMAGVKAINDKKSQQRDVASDVRRPTLTPTSAPDRVAILVSSARAIVGGTRAAQLSRVVPR